MIKKPSKIYLISSILLLIFDFYYLGVFNPNKILVKEPIENTAPDYDVIIGSSKLKWNIPDSLKKYNFDCDYVWMTRQNKSNFNKFKLGSTEYEEYYFVVSYEFVGKTRESEGVGDWNPKIDIKNIHKINFFAFWGFIILTLASCVITLFFYRRK